MPPSKSLITAALSAFAAMALSSSPAIAKTQENRSVEVYFGDLDLDTDTGARALKHRIRSAARTVCSPRPGVGLNDRLNYSNCFSSAVSSGSTAAVTILVKAKSNQKFASRDHRIIVSN